MKGRMSYQMAYALNPAGAGLTSSELYYWMGEARKKNEGGITVLDTNDPPAGLEDKLGKLHQFQRGVAAQGLEFKQDKESLERFFEQQGSHYLAGYLTRFTPRWEPGSDRVGASHTKQALLFLGVHPETRAFAAARSVAEDLHVDYARPSIWGFLNTY